MRNLTLVVALAALLALLSGCATNNATGDVTPGVDLAEFQNLYVVKTPEDRNGVAELITTRLGELGYNAASGPALESYEDADALVTYVDRWMWDITMYMLELTITVEDAQSGYRLASGNSLHTSLTRLSPEEMVDEVLGNIFGSASEGSE